jgi:hypothetical protein
MKYRSESMVKRRKGLDIYAKYRRILKMPDLSNRSIDKMRENLELLAQTICEHVWRKKFY